MKNNCLLCGKSWRDVGHGHGLYVTEDSRLEDGDNFCHVQTKWLDDRCDWLYGIWNPMCEERASVPESAWFTINDPLVVLYVANWMPVDCWKGSPFANLSSEIMDMNPPRSFVDGIVVSDVPWESMWRPTKKVSVETKPRLQLRYYHV